MIKSRKIQISTLSKWISNIQEDKKIELGMEHTGVNSKDF